MPTVADFVLERLGAWGVDRIFGYPGDGINGFLGALGRSGARLTFVEPRHEEMAAFMACGHAKFTGNLGVCLATSGPGAIHLLNGLYDAKADGQPVLAIVGQQRRVSLGAAYQQEVDLQTLFSDVSTFVQTCMAPEQARHLVDRAARAALTRGGVTTLIFPNDVQEADAVPSPPRAHGSVFLSPGYTRPRVLPDAGALARAASVLDQGERVAILAGRGAAGAHAELAEIAELLGAGVAKALLGKTVLPDDLPYVTGSIGLLGTRATYELMKGCDTLLIVGSSFPYAEWLPEEGRATVVQIDLHADRLALRVPVDVQLAGDARETLRALMPLLTAKVDRSWREAVETFVTASRRSLEARSKAKAEPLNPEYVAMTLNHRLPDQAILTADSGSSTVWWARNVFTRPDMLASVSGGLASMGSAVPYAIAAKLAHPHRPVIAFLGDGAFQMNGMSELITAVTYAHLWHDPRLVFAVFANADLNMVTWEQRALAGDPANPDTQFLPHVPIADVAQLLGLHARRCDHADAVGDAWDDALAAGRPALIEFVVDADYPLLPPHVSLRQARNTIAALVRHDPRTKGIVRRLLSTKLAERMHA
jgi:pyruvate dehydrogenase (quinone)